MRKRAILTLAAALLLLLTAPAAYAGSNEPLSPERKNHEDGILSDAISLPELPTAEIRMTALANSSGGGILQVTTDQVMQAVETVTSGDAVSITITADSNEEISSISTVLPKEALAAVVDQTDAEMTVASDLGQITLSNDEIGTIIKQSETVEIAVTMTRETSGAKVDILSGGKSITGWSGAEGPAVLSPLVAQLEDTYSSRGNVRLYAACLCIAAAVLLTGGVIVGMAMKHRSKTAGKSFERK